MTHTHIILEVAFEPGKSILLGDGERGIAIIPNDGGKREKERLANAHRITALWNMAERLGLSTEEIEAKESMFRAAADMLKALEWYGWKVDEHRKNTLEGDRARYDLDRDGGSRAYAAIKKARGEE